MKGNKLHSEQGLTFVAYTTHIDIARAEGMDNVESEKVTELAECCENTKLKAGGIKRFPVLSTSGLLTSHRSPPSRSPHGFSLTSGPMSSMSNTP
jgi:hypothetical protein